MIPWTVDDLHVGVEHDALQEVGEQTWLWADGDLAIKQDDVTDYR